MADLCEVIAAEANKFFNQEYQPIIDCLLEAKVTGDLAQESVDHLIEGKQINLLQSSNNLTKGR